MRDRNIPKVAHTCKKPPYHEEENIQEKAVMMIMSIEDHIGIGDPLKEEDTQIKVEGHLIEEDIPIEMEGLPEEKNILEEDPLMVEDPLKMPPGPPGG